MPITWTYSQLQYFLIIVNNKMPKVDIETFKNRKKAKYVYVYSYFPDLNIFKTSFYYG